MAKKISESLRPGRAHVTFDPHNANNTMVKQLYTELLGGLVTDPDLIDALAVNAHKFKHRFFFTTTIYDGAGDEVATVTDYGRKTLQEFVEAYRFLQPGLKIGYPDGVKNIEIARTLGIPEGGVNIANGSHIIGRVETTLVFAKGQTQL